MKNLVDSCGWIEYFENGPNAGFFAPAIEDSKTLLVPSICLAEVFRHIARNAGQNVAHQTVAAMLQCEIVELDAEIAITAAKIGLENGIPIADSIILATSYSKSATLWTQDSHFKSIAEVRYVEKL